MQLNPREFDAVPQHVVDLCAELLREWGSMSGILRLRLWPGMARNSDSAAHSARAFVRVAVELTMPMATFHSLGA